MNTSRTARRVQQTPDNDGKDRKILSVRERESLKNYVEMHKEDHTEDGQHYVAANNPQEAEGIKRMEGILKNGEPEPLNDRGRARLEREASELEACLVKMMVPRKLMGLRPGPDPMFRIAVNEMVRTEMSPEFQQIAARWKNLMRRIDPSDPNISNLERIRPEER